jgi:flagellar motility protein MotE (MotC chaperone)
MRLMAKSARLGSRNVLVIVAALFVGSGVIRIGIGSGQAFALGDISADGQMESEPFACTPDQDPGGILNTILARERALIQAERTVAEQLKSIDFAKAEIRQNLMQLEAAEQKLAATMATVKNAAESDLARLTSVYENMKPKDASTLFSEMAPDFSAGFIARMRPEAAAKIMTGLDPATAYSISVIMAGRNANTPTE